METKSTTERLTELIAKETKIFAEKESSLKEAYSKFSKIGIETKSTYSFPLKDTIGKTFREQVQFISADQDLVANTGYMQ